MVIYRQDGDDLAGYAHHDEGAVGAVETEVAPIGHCHDLTTPGFTQFAGAPVEMNRWRPVRVLVKERGSRDVRCWRMQVVPSRADEEWWLL